LRHFCGFSPVSSTSKTDHHDITEIRLKVALNTMTLTPVWLIFHRVFNDGTNVEILYYHDGDIVFINTRCCLRICMFTSVYGFTMFCLFWYFLSYTIYVSHLSNCDVYLFIHTGNSFHIFPSYFTFYPVKFLVLIILPYFQDPKTTQISNILLLVTFRKPQTLQVHYLCYVHC